MATKTILLRGYKTGVASSLTLNVTSYDGTSSIQAGITATETATGSGIYAFSMTTAVSSTKTTYGAAVLRSGSLIGNFVVDLVEATGEYPLVNEPSLAQIQSTAAAGINPVTITVTDTSNNPVQFAAVSITSGNASYGFGVTNSSGVIVLPLNNGTYTLAAGGLAQYTGNTATLVVSGVTSQTIVITALSVTPSTAPQVTGYLTCYDQEGNTLAGQLFIFTPIGTVDGAAGGSFSKTPWSVQSASNGLVQTTFVYNVNYYIQRGQNGTQVKFTAPNTTFQLPDCLG